MYTSEKNFVSAFCRKLRSYKFDVVRLESHYTENGIPDAFVQGFGFDLFIEFKNKPNVSITCPNPVIDWRPGQLAWATLYRQKHLNRKNTLTIQACKDGILIIPHIKRNVIKKNVPEMVIRIPDDMEWNIIRTLRLFSTSFHYEWKESHGQHINHLTFRELVNAFAETYYPYVTDYDVDVLWDCDSFKDLRRIYSDPDSIANDNVTDTDIEIHLDCLYYYFEGANHVC